MADIAFRQTVPDDVFVIARDLREADRRELEALRGKAVNVPLALAKAVRQSSHAWTAESAGAPVALFGVAPISLLEGIASPWLLGTDRVRFFARSLIRSGRWYADYMRAIYPTLLYNYVDARNADSVRWLKRLGFNIHPPEAHGVSGLPFHRFEMRSK